MHLLRAALIWLIGVTAAAADRDVDALVGAMGVPGLIAAFSAESVDAGRAIDAAFLNGQGGDVWAETVRRLYDPVRLEQELRTAMAASLDPEVTAQALLFFESDLGARIVDLEVQARQAMLDPDLEAAARAAPTITGDAVNDFLTIRDLIERNTDTAMRAQTAFFDGLARSSGREPPASDPDALRASLRSETESWLRGYYALAQSPLSADEVAIYTAFWDTDVGRAIDDALFAAFGDSYTALSFGLGQAAGRLLPQNDL